MTLQLKSNLAAPERSRQRQEYLTTVVSDTFDGLNPEEVLAQSGNKTVVLIAVAVVPKSARTGLLEERGEWVHALWSATLSQMPSLQGCRMGWDSVFFVAETTDLGVVQEQFRPILLSLRQPDLESRCILSLAEGSPQDKGKLLYDEMSHDLTAEGIGFRSRFGHKLKDGMYWRD